MSHLHYFTVMVLPPWWAPWRGATLACKCGTGVNEAHEDMLAERQVDAR